jgi:hypothetical protein
MVSVSALGVLADSPLPTARTIVAAAMGSRGR